MRIATPAHYQNLSISVRPLAAQPASRPVGPQFKGLMDELKEEYKNLEELNRIEQEETDYQKQVEMTQKAKEMLSTKILSINNREFNGLETIQLLDEMTKANKSWNRKYVPLLWNIPGLIPATLLGIFATPFAFLVVPAAITGLVAFFDGDLFNGNIRPYHMSALAHKKTPLPPQEAAKVLDSMAEVGLLTKTYVSSEGGSYWNYNLSPIALKVLKEHELLAPAPPLKRTRLTRDAKATGNRQAPTLSILLQPQSRLKTLKFLISPSPIDGKTGYQQLEHLVSRYDKRFPLGRIFEKGLPQKEIYALFPGHEVELVHRQLESMRINGLLEKTEKSGKVFWKPTDQARNLLKQGDPQAKGLVNDTDLKEILQLEIEELEAAKVEKNSQFKELETHYQQLVKDLELLGSDIGSQDKKIASLLEKHTDETNAETKKALAQDIRKETTQLKRLQSLKTLKSELVERLKAELEAKQLLLHKRLDQIEQSITTLMESQIKLSVLKADQGIAGVMKQLQDSEREQLAGEQQFGEQTQWITQQIQQSFDSPEGKQQIADALLAIKTQEALDTEQDNNTLAELARAMGERKQAMK